MNKESEMNLKEQVQIMNCAIHDPMFSPENLLKRVRKYAQDKQYTETEKAIELMVRYHEGTYRKSLIGEKLPYIVHPLTMACQAFALKIDSDELIASILLHDVVEDCDVTVEELDVNDEIKKVVSYLTYVKREDLSEDESKGLYYDRIGTSKTASIVKLLDRCNNVSSMVTAFKPEKLRSYVKETETYVFPLLEKVTNEYEECYEIAFVLKYQLYGLIEIFRRFL